MFDIPYLSRFKYVKVIFNNLLQTSNDLILIVF